MIPPGSPALARPSEVRPLWSLAGPALGALLAAGLLAESIGPLASMIGYSLGLSPATTTLAVVAPSVVATAALVAPGYLLGRRWPTATAVPALGLLGIGSVVSAIAPGAVGFAAGRVVGGLGAGTVVGVAFALSGQLDRWRSRARLVLGLALGAAFLLGLIASNLLATALGFRLVFMVDVLVAVVALAGTGVGGIAMLVLRSSRPSPPAAPATTTPLPDEPGPAAQHTDNPPTLI